jgi:hypothetical protein
MKRWCLLGLSLVLAGCPAVPSEPPPPAAELEIPVAPPRARGAKAGGSDAAPKPYLAPEGAAEPSIPLPPPVGAAPDGGTAPTPEPAPDAGMAL